MKKKLAISSGILAAVVALGIGMYQSDASSADPRLNHDEVKSLVSSQYPGTITELEFEKDDNRAVYEIEIENDGMEYELKVDANSGEIIKLKEKRIASKQPVKVDEAEDKVEKMKLEDDKENKVEKENKAESNQNNVTKEKSNLQTKVDSKESKTEVKKETVIDKSRAIEIALAEFPGKVEEVELDEEDGRLIYEIEIENGNQEAEFEIDAMTGKIIVIEIDN